MATVSPRRLEAIHKTIELLCSTDVSDHLRLDVWSRKNQSGPVASASESTSLVDIGINTQGAPDAQFFSELLRAKAAGVDHVIFTGTDAKRNRVGWTRCQEMKALVDSEKDLDDPSLSLSSRLPALHFTAGVHPHQAVQCEPETLADIENYAKASANPAVAIGECGLDYDRMFSPREVQLKVFRDLVDLAVRLQLPLFVHERDRDGHRKRLPLGSCHDLCTILDDYCKGENPSLKPSNVCIHCFTGGKNELNEYLSRGYWIGLTGFVAMRERGAILRQLISDGQLPLDRILIETDAPYMRGDSDYYVEMAPPITLGNEVDDTTNAKQIDTEKTSQSKIKRRRNNRKARPYTQPGDVTAVAKALSELVDVPYETVCHVTTLNAIEFFRLKNST